MVNDHMGAMIADRGPVAAGAVALVLLFLTQPMSYLPKAVLGAVIVSAAIGLVDPGAWHALRLVSRFALGIAAATLLGSSLPGAGGRTCRTDRAMPSELTTTCWARA